MTDLSRLMRAVPAKPAAAAPGTPAEKPSAAGVWTTSSGRQIPMANMNPYHRENAIKKARREGRADLAAQLEASRPKED